MLERAITRKPGPSLARGLTTSSLGEPNYRVALQQHELYARALKSLGLEVTVLEPLPDYPDAHFVEDTAVVVREFAVITNPGAPSRRGEVDSIRPVLAKYRSTFRMNPPGTLDGGDVLVLGRHVLIGISHRTDDEGASQLIAILDRYDYTWAKVPVVEGLHLKSSVNCIGEDALLVTEKFAALAELQGYDMIVVENAEEYAANSLWIRDRLLMPGGFPKTKTKLELLGFKIVELNVSEMRKMDGGLTCLSIRI